VSSSYSEISSDGYQWLRHMETSSWLLVIFGRSFAVYMCSPNDEVTGNQLRPHDVTALCGITSLNATCLKRQNSHTPQPIWKQAYISYFRLEFVVGLTATVDGSVNVFMLIIDKMLCDSYIQFMVQVWSILIFTSHNITVGLMFRSIRPPIFSRNLVKIYLHM